MSNDKVLVSRELLNKVLASSDELTRFFVDDCNGPGAWYCHACEGYTNPHWSGGKIVKGSWAQIAHDDGCWAEELRTLLAQPTDGASTNEGDYKAALQRAWKAGYDTALYGEKPAHHGHRCTCPSGDGSLRWPCPVHPPEVKP